MADGRANWEEEAMSVQLAGGRGGGASAGLTKVNLADGSPARDHRSFDKEVTRAARALTDAGLAVYPVDARGLAAMG